MKKALYYIIPIISGFLIGFISQQVQMDAIENWYPYLNKPSLTPPDSVFPIVWWLIYVLSGISFGIILNTRSTLKFELSALWISQLLLNLLWSLFFFYMRNPLLGLITILVLDIIVIWYTFRAYKVNKISSILFLLYIAWLLFATYLNFYILLNN